MWWVVRLSIPFILLPENRSACKRLNLWNAQSLVEDHVSIHILLPLFTEPSLLPFISRLLGSTTVRIRISDLFFPVSILISPLSLPAKKNSIRDQTTFSVYRQISVTLINLYHWNWNHRCSARWHPNRCYEKRYPKWVRWERPYQNWYLQIPNQI